MTSKGKPVVRPTPTPARRPGALKGLFELPDSFFDPLPDDVLEDFYGKDGLVAVKRLERDEAERRKAMPS
jgi:hypothetical protein